MGRWLMKFCMFIKLGVVLLFVSSPAWANKDLTILLAYGDNDGAPYAIEESDKLSAGLIKDISTELAAFLDLNIEYVKIPRQRIERYLENNDIHIVLFSNPDWLSNSEKLQWSDEIFYEEDLVVVREDNPKTFNKIEDLRGMTLGTIRGYHYANLQPYFDDKFFVRYDVSTLEVNFIRLSLNRIDSLVGANVLIKYYLKTSRNPESFKVLPFTVSSHPVKAAISPNAPIDINKFNAALSQLKSEGVIEAILEKYQINNTKSLKINK